MGTLFTIQPEDREPIEFTHFDCWFTSEEDEYDEPDLEAFDEADDEALERKLTDILDSWEKTLGMTIPRADSRVIGVDYALDIAIVAILEEGYDVYKSDTFIEIFKGEEE